MELKLSGRRALVTGGGRGIGLSIIRELEAEGCEVIGVTRSLPKEKIGDQSFLKKFHVVDLMDDSSRKTVIQELVNIYGHFDIIVNNVGGTMNENDPLSDLSTYEKVMKYNFGIAVDINHAFIPKMIEQKWGRICHVSSISALENQGPPAYSAAKAALNAYTRGLGRYLAQNNIIITSIMPGAIFTEGGYWDNMKSENPLKLNEYLTNRMAIGRLGEVGEVSRLVAFLVSENSSFMVGSNILVDGGQGRAFYQN